MYFALSQFGVFSLNIGLHSKRRNPAQKVSGSLDSTRISWLPTRDKLKWQTVILRSYGSKLETTNGYWLEWLAKVAG